MSDENKGIIEQLRDAPVINYDSSRGLTLTDLEDLIEASKIEKYQKPVYCLTNQEAREYDLGILDWMGKHFTVVCSIEARNIVLERELKSQI